MTQLHCKIETLDDGTVVASSSEHHLVIRPVGEGRAFNRNALKHRVGSDNLPALLNNLSARIRQGKTELDEGWQELEKMVVQHREPEHERWLVGELNGVRVYIRGNSYIMTTEDLYG